MFNDSDLHFNLIAQNNQIFRGLGYSFDDILRHEDDITDIFSMIKNFHWEGILFNACLSTSRISVVPVPPYFLVRNVLPNQQFTKSISKRLFSFAQSRTIQNLNL